MAPFSGGDMLPKLINNISTNIKLKHGFMVNQNYNFKLYHKFISVIKFNTSDIN